MDDDKSPDYDPIHVPSVDRVDYDAPVERVRLGGASFGDGLVGVGRSNAPLTGDSVKNARKRADTSILTLHKAYSLLLSESS